jgi:FlaA1/EpsC-like NDP-sugar epimerase
MIKGNKIKGLRCLVSGGAGSIGSEIVRQLAVDNKVFVFDISENAYGLSQELSQKGYWVKPRVGDIRDKDTVRDLFADFKPEIVFHAAAYKEVSPMETYPEEAVKTNILGTLNLLHEAKRYECLKKFVNISTDKVVNANSIMGISKKVSEVVVKNAGGVSVRFGNVMGSRGSLLPIWQRQHDNGEPLTITDERMSRYMMTIPEAVELVITAAENGNPGEIYCLEMGQRWNILELAKEITKKTGQEIKTIGIRPGETMDERLMSHEELETAVKKDKFWILK